MTPTWLQRLARFASQRYRLVFVLWLLTLVAGVFLVTRLRFDTDILSLLPRKDPVVQAYLETLNELGTFDYLMAVVHIPEGAAADPYQAYVDDFAARLAKVPEIAEVEHRLEDVEQLLAGLMPNAALLLDETGRAELSERLSDAGIRARLAEVRRVLATPQAFVLKDIARLDPLGVSDILMERVQSGRGAMAVDWMSGYYLSQDQRLLLILAKPTKAPQNIAFDRAMMANVEAARRETDARWKELSGLDTPPPLVQVGGSHVAAMIDGTLIQRDMVLNIASSMGLVLLLFLISFRRLGTLAYAFLPLATGLLLTFAFSSLVFGTVSSATSGTAALLIGLGIDFVIVSYGRFVEERERGSSLETALDTVMGSTSKATLFCALTTSASFYAFTFTDFIGLRQMGILTGSGILFCLLSVFILLPAMLAWSEEHHRKRSKEPKHYTHGFGVEPVLRFSLRHPKPILAVGLVLTVAAALAATRLGFQDSWREMRPEGNVGVDVEKEVADHFKSDFDFMTLVLKGKDEGELLERTDDATRRAQKLVADGVLRGVMSVTSVLPPPSRQQEILAWLRAGRADGSLDPMRIRTSFLAAAEAEGLRPSFFEPGLDLLSQALSLERPATLDQVPVQGQAKKMLDRVLHQTRDGWRSVIYLYPPAEVWRREPPPQTRALAAELGPDAVLTGANVINEVMRHRIRRDAWIAVALGTLLVFLLLWWDFRRMGVAAMCMVPLLLGVVWMLGGMVALGIDMNFMNVFVTTMIIGIGVDYGIHMVHRFREAASTPGVSVGASLAETGGAVVIAALSTVVGFGSLATSHYPGLRSTGYVATLGALCAAAVAVTLLPAAFSLWLRRQGVDPTK